MFAVNIEEELSDLSWLYFINHNPYKTFICDPLCQYPTFLYLLPYGKMISIYCEMMNSADSGYLCSSIPFLTFPALVLGRTRDVPPCWAFGGRKRGLRRKLCRSFSFWSFSHASARSFLLASSFHFGLGLVWFGFWNILADFNRIFTVHWCNQVSLLPRGSRACEITIITCITFQNSEERLLIMLLCPVWSLLSPFFVFCFSN